MWEARYYDRYIDRLVIRELTFDQHYYDGLNGPQLLTVTGNPWRLEKGSDGWVRLYLKKAKYLRLGIANADFIGTYDPFAHKTIQTNEELVLQVLIDSTGNQVLHHLFLDPDEGLPLSGNEVDVFRKVGAVED